MRGHVPAIGQQCHRAGQGARDDLGDHRDRRQHHDPAGAAFRLSRVGHEIRRCDQRSWGWGRVAGGFIRDRYSTAETPVRRRHRSKARAPGPGRARAPGRAGQAPLSWRWRASAAPVCRQPAGSLLVCAPVLDELVTIWRQASRQLAARAALPRAVSCNCERARRPRRRPSARSRCAPPPRPGGLMVEAVEADLGGEVRHPYRP